MRSLQQLRLPLRRACQVPSVTWEDQAVQADIHHTVNFLLYSSDSQLQNAFIAGSIPEMNAVLYADIDFCNATALQNLAGNINQHISSLSNGQITNLCDPEQWDPDTALSVVSATYFNGLWLDPFSVRPGTFTLADGQQVTLPRVLQITTNWTSQYSRSNGWQAVTIPYTGEHEMVFILPPEGQTPDLVTPHIVDDLLSSLYYYDVHIDVPAFSIDSEVQLGDLLAQTGLASLFYLGRLRLGHMLFGPRPLTVNRVTQRCFIDVNERGVERPPWVNTSQSKTLPVVVNFNRPFLYILRSSHSGKIVFMGQIFQPQMVQPSP